MTITAKVQIVSPQNHGHVIMSYLFPILSLIWGMLLRFHACTSQRFIGSNPSYQCLPHTVWGWVHMEDQQDRLLRHYIDLLLRSKWPQPPPLAAPTAFTLG